MKKNKKRNAKHSSKKKSYAGLIAFVVTLVVFIGLYGAVGLFFSNHFLPGTTLNKADVSFMNVSQAKEAIVSTGEAYVLTLNEQNNNQEIVNGEDIGVKTTITDDFNRILDTQSGLMWIADLFEDKSYVLDEGVITYSYDDGKLSDTVDKLDCVKPKNPIEAKDAELVYMDGEFKIVPEIIGNVAHRDKLEEKIKYAVENQKTSIDLEKEGIYDIPKITSGNEELLAKKAACDEIANMKITLKFGDKDEVIEGQMLSTWVTPKKNKKGEYTIETDEKKIEEYVKKLAESYDTVGEPKDFLSHSGTVVHFLTGDYGWLMDQEEAVKKIQELVQARKTVTVNLTDGSEKSTEWWMRTGVGYDSNGQDYYGNTYAEVSITEQHMWMYKDGEVVFESDVVTGNPNLGNDTPIGAFRIRYHQENAILVGPGYAQPVAYWMVFADDVGFHDATWQPYFGGDLYLWNGSHGCVNMPLDKAGELFNLIYDNMPVFVY